MASPNPSSPSLTSSPTSSRTVSPSRNPQSATQQSRQPNNRAALRDYYNLKSTANKTTTTTTTTNESSSESSTAPPKTPISDSPLDSPSFDPEAHVHHLLSTLPLPALLRAESALINDIRGLDGERKALVYDNYSKLITATETIGKMRRNMDPLTPTTSTLGPAVGQIAETAAGLREKGRAGVGGVKLVDEEVDVGEDKRQLQRQQQQQSVETVKWALGTPRRLSRLLEAGQRETADQDWSEIKALLGKWKGVRGVDELKVECERMMERP